MPDSCAIVILTVSLWWSLLECGLALIAACLPTLSYLFSRFSIQSAIKSVRSALSLRTASSTQRSIDLSKTASSNEHRAPYVNLGDNYSGESQRRMAGKVRDEEYAYTVRELSEP